MILSVAAAVAAMSLGLGDRCAYGRANQRTCGLEQIGGAVTTDPLGRGTWVADEERDEVTLVSDEGSVLATRACAWPERVVVAQSGRAFVNCRAAGSIAVLDAEGFGIELSVGFEPRGLALDGETNTLFIGTASQIVELDTTTLSLRRTYAAPVSPDYLALAEGGLVVLARNSAELGWIPVDVPVPLGSKELLPGAAPRFGIIPLSTRPALSDSELRRKERDAFALRDARRKDSWNGQLLARTSGGIAVFFAQMDITRESSAASAGYYGGGPVPFELHLAVVNGSGTVGAADALGGYADVTGAQEFEGELFVALRNQTRLARVGQSFFGGRLNPDVEVGEGAVGLAADSNGKLRTFASFERTVKIVEAVVSAPRETRGEANVHAVTGSVGLSEGRLSRQLATGRALYYSSHSSVTASGISCNGCHPDGREDGLAWSSAGQIRQTPLLAGRIEDSAPYGWLGEHATLEASIEHSIVRLGGTGVSVEELRALAEYVRSGLREAPVPPAAMPEVVLAQGKRAFELAECGSCHDGAAFTDGENYALGYELRKDDAKRDKAQSFNTPSLKAVAISAPYLHDGSAKTLLELVVDPHDRMGKTSALTMDDRHALVAYLKTL